MGRNYGNELILAAGTGRIGITLIIDASNITVEPTKSTWMPTAVGARSLGAEQLPPPTQTRISELIPTSAAADRTRNG